MCVRFQPPKPIPPKTVEVAKAALGKDNIVMKLRDELGTLYQDSDFSELFSHEGQPGICPWRLAIVCVLQYLDNLSDRGAAEAVRTRIDWKYALSLELTDPGFDFLAVKALTRCNSMDQFALLLGAQEFPWRGLAFLDLLL